MGYYQNLLAQINQVDSQGFNPYTETYGARIGKLEAPVTDVSAGAVTSTPVETDPATKVLETNDPYVQAWTGYGPSQANVTRAFQTKYPEIDVAGILNEYKGREDFSNKDLDKYAKELTAKYGELLMTSDQVNKADANYYKYLNTLKQKDTGADTRGTKEKDTDDELFGWRNLLERRYKEGEEPYKYLDLMNDEEIMNKAKESGKNAKK